MLEEWERLYFVGKSRDRGSMVAIRDGGSDFIYKFSKKYFLT